MADLVGYGAKERQALVERLTPAGPAVADAVALLVFAADGECDACAVRKRPAPCRRCVQVGEALEKLERVVADARG